MEFEDFTYRIRYLHKTEDKIMFYIPNLLQKKGKFIEFRQLEFSQCHQYSYCKKETTLEMHLIWYPHKHCWGITKCLYLLLQYFLNN